MLQHQGCVIEENTQYNSLGKSILERWEGESQEACANLSAETEGALFWTYHKTSKQCFVLSSMLGKKEKENIVSGNRECGEASETGFDYSNTYWE